MNDKNTGFKILSKQYHLKNGSYVQYLNFFRLRDYNTSGPTTFSFD